MTVSWPLCDWINLQGEAHFIFSELEPHNIHLMTDSMWVTLYILLNDCLTTLVSWPTESKLHFTFSESSSLLMNANRMWVPLHIFLNCSLMTSILWPTESECHCICFWKAVPMESFLWPKESEQYCIVSDLIPSCSMTNRKWAALSQLNLSMYLNDKRK